MSSKRKLEPDRGPSSNAEKVDKVFKRNFEHVEGNWASHIYFPVRVNTKLKQYIRSANCSIQKELESQLPYNMQSVVTDKRHHISLSKVFVLKAFQIERFIANLSKAIQQCRFLSSK
jgi:hypothetical protein